LPEVDLSLYSWLSALFMEIRRQGWEKITMKRLTGFLLAAALMASAATPASAQMFLDRFSAECKKGALYGAVAGGVLGAVVSKDKNRMENAAIGAAAGGAAGCLINKQLTKTDNEKVLALEKRAAKAGVPKSASWTNSAKSKVAATAYPDPIVNGCRQVRVDLSVDGGQSQSFAGDKFCKSSNGAWTLVQS
jgi:surface antigen